MPEQKPTDSKQAENSTLPPIDIPKRRLKNKILWILVGSLIAVIALVVVTKPSTPQKQVTIYNPIAKLKPAKLGLEQIAKGLKAPTAIVSSGQPDDTNLYVLEQAGTVKLISGGKVANKAVLDLSSKINPKSEMGLLGMAFDPQFKSNGFIYINYVDKQVRTNISRFHIGSDGTLEPGSEQVLLQLQQPYPNHNGGDLVFGPDGFLYATLGDGGSAGDPQNRAQDKAVLFGKILRIEVGNQKTYTVPKSNPFVGQPGARPEIWAYGLRNPWKISFDSKTGELYIADVGQKKIEEVDVQPAGQGGNNYGWRCFEGNSHYNKSGCLGASSYVAPAFEYTHANKRCSVTGGFVYRGKLFPALVGEYIFGDFCSGEVMTAGKVSGKWQQTVAVQTKYKISTFGQDNSGEIYLADYATGNIYHIVDKAN